MSGFIPRKLWYLDNREKKEIGQAAIAAIDGPAVVLGEAGMGKTSLLGQLAEQPGHAWCTARQLINRRGPRSLLGDASVLVIDALDEVVAQREGDAVDLVLQKLGDLDYPRFILSCRVADWLSATSVAAIGEQYPVLPEELHLVPFSDEDATAFLTERLSADRAAEVVAHFERHGLKGFLGNPQTLEMIERVAPTGDLPRTSSALFERTIDIIWKEHRDDKARFELPRDKALDAAGAAFAAQLLTGSEAISRQGAANIEDGDLALPEVEDFDSGNVNAVFGTRMFRAMGAERFTYWHRRIGEYLGARWLAARADDPAKRRRLFAVFHQGGLVPVSLRGVHAWLALDPDLASTVIDIDPMGVVEYGDADVLNPAQARIAIDALKRTAIENPAFRDRGPYRAQGLVRPELLAEVRASITSADTPLGVKLLLLKQLERANIASDLAAELEALLLDPGKTFVERGSAADALAGFESGPDWPATVEQLRRLADVNSTRLAAELIQAVGYEQFDDDQIAATVLAHLGVTLRPVTPSRRHRTVGNLHRFKRELPTSRLDGVIDLVAEYVEQFVNQHQDGSDDLADVLLALIRRRIEADGADAAKVWRWLRLVREGLGYDRRAREGLDGALGKADPLRREIQRQVLLEGDPSHNLRQRAMRLGRPSQVLAPSPADLVVLLGALDPADRTDQRWRELLELTRHSATEGVKVRNAAKPFAAHRQDLTDWIDGLAAPRVPEWQKKQERERLRRQGKKATEWALHRAEHLKRLPEMRSGDFGELVNPAKSYLKLFHDMGEVEAHQRVAEWLGPDVADAAHEGFEAFIRMHPASPTAVEVAHAVAKGEVWDARHIIVAALAERMRLEKGYADLPAERLIAGWIELRHREDEHAGFPGLRDELAEEIRRRGKWRSAQVLLIKPQLKQGGRHVEGLYELMRDKSDEKTPVDLAIGWLRRIDATDHQPEREMIARVIASPRSRELVPIAAAKLASGTLPPDRHRSWLAAQLIVDFAAFLTSIGAGPVEKELLWDVREHLGMRRSDQQRSRHDLSVEQLGWVIGTFRAHWPAVGHPSGSSSGESNPWDATDFLNWAIARLGDHADDAGVVKIDELRQVADGYRDHVLIVAAEQRRKVVESTYRPPGLGAVATALAGGPPTGTADLQAVMLDAIETAQKRLKGDPLDWYKGFYREDGRHRNEESCRDELMKMLDGKVAGVEMRPESHMADEKRVDIECSASASVMVPVEIKGQWHKEIWTAADSQLEKLYSSDWRADRRGIYLILWFGIGTPLTSPPAGIVLPTTPEELRASLADNSAACKTGMVEVVVLDLTRP